MATSKTEAKIQEALASIGALDSRDRDKYDKLIKQREDTMIKALNEEFSGGTDRMLETLRREHDVTMLPSQISELIVATSNQIKEETSKLIVESKKKIEIEMADTDDAISQEEAEMKERHRQEYAEFITNKRARLEVFRVRIQKAEEEVANTKVPHLLEERRKLQAELIRVKKVEQDIAHEAQKRMAILRQSKGRILSLVADRSNHAREQLLKCVMRDDADTLLQSIPTAREAIESCQTIDSIKELIVRLDPCTPPALPPGKAQVVEAPAPAEATISNLITGNITEVVEYDEDGDPIDQAEKLQEQAEEDSRQIREHMSSVHNRNGI